MSLFSELFKPKTIDKKPLAVMEKIKVLQDVSRFEGWEFVSQGQSYKVNNGKLVTPKGVFDIKYIGAVTSEAYLGNKDDAINFALPENFPDDYPAPLLLGNAIEPKEGGYLFIGLPNKKYLIRFIEKINKPKD